MTPATSGDPASNAEVAAPCWMFFSVTPVVPEGSKVGGGVSVPEDVSVVGFDDVAGAAYFVPPLTTVRQPILEKGRRVGELLLDAELEPRQVLLPIEIVVRGSTGAPTG